MKDKIRFEIDDNNALQDLQHSIHLIYRLVNVNTCDSLRWGYN